LTFILKNTILIRQIQKGIAILAKQDVWRLIQTNVFEQQAGQYPKDIQPQVENTQ